MRSLARSLVLHRRIKTTEAKAKEVRPMVEKLMTRAKRDTIANRRMLIAALGDAATAAKLVKAAEGYSGRNGGYLRIVKLAPRAGDAAKMAVIEFI